MEAPPPPQPQQQEQQQEIQTQTQSTQDQPQPMEEENKENINNNNNNGLGEDENSLDSNTSSVTVAVKGSKKGVKRSGKTPKKKATTPAGNLVIGGENNNNGTNASGSDAPLKPSSMPRHTANPERRRLENEAYAAVLTAFKLQGELTWEKESLLQDLRFHLKIADDRHRMETKRLEEMLPTRKRGREEGLVSEGDESDVNVGYEEGNASRKIQITEGDPLIVVPAPSSDSAPAWLNKVPDLTKVSLLSKKTKETPKKRAKKEEKEKRQPGTGKYRKDAPFPSNAKEIEENIEVTSLPPDVLQAKVAGDQNRIRENLERHRAEILAQMEASSTTNSTAVASNSSPPQTASQSQIGFILNNN